MSLKADLPAFDKTSFGIRQDKSIIHLLLKPGSSSSYAKAMDDLARRATPMLLYITYIRVLSLSREDGNPVV